MNGAADGNRLTLAAGHGFDLCVERLDPDVQLAERLRGFFLRRERRAVELVSRGIIYFLEGDDARARKFLEKVSITARENYSDLEEWPVGEHG